MPPAPARSMMTYSPSTVPGARLDGSPAAEGDVSPVGWSSIGVITIDHHPPGGSKMRALAETSHLGRNRPIPRERTPSIRGDPSSGAVVVFSAPTNGDRGLVGHTSYDEPSTQGAPTELDRFGRSLAAGRFAGDLQDL